jgi:hypothetical protein
MRFNCLYFLELLSRISLQSIPIIQRDIKVKISILGDGDEFNIYMHFLLQIISRTISLNIELEL